MATARPLVLALCLASAIATRAQAEAPKAYALVDPIAAARKPDGEGLSQRRSGDNRAKLAPRQSGGGQPPHTRAYYDFVSGNSWTQVIGDPTAIPCTKSAFNRDDWGDPFAKSASMLERLKKEKTTDLGTETVGTIKTKLVAATAPNSSATAKLWIEPKTDLIVKFELLPRESDPRVMIEVRDLKLAPAAAAMFELTGRPPGAVFSTAATRRLRPAGIVGPDDRRIGLGQLLVRPRVLGAGKNIADDVEPGRVLVVGRDHRPWRMRRMGSRSIGSAPCCRRAIVLRLVSIGLSFPLRQGSTRGRGGAASALSWRCRDSI